jgi:hypothetical protein
MEEQEVENIVNQEISRRRKNFLKKASIPIMIVLLVGIPAMADVNIRDAGDLVLGEDTNLDANGNNLTSVNSIYYESNDWPDFQSEYGDYGELNLIRVLVDWNEGDISLTNGQLAALINDYQNGASDWPDGDYEITPAQVNNDGYIVGMNGIESLGGIEILGDTEIDGELEVSSTNCGSNEAITGDGSCQSVGGTGSTGGIGFDLRKVSGNRIRRGSSNINSGDTFRTSGTSSGYGESKFVVRGSVREWTNCGTSDRTYESRDYTLKLLKNGNQVATSDGGSISKVINYDSSTEIKAKITAEETAYASASLGCSWATAEVTLHKTV